MKNKTISHIVIFWLKKEITNTQRNSIIEAAKTLETIPGIVTFQYGKMIPSDRKIVDSTYDFALNITFQSEKDLNIYLEHKTHTSYVNSYIKPNIEKIQVYDF